MVRLLTVEQYGQYRDFLLYATLLLPWIHFQINGSLAYFVPKEPQRDRQYLTQATGVVLATSAVAVSLLLIFTEYLPSETIRSYILPLCLYILFLSNLDAWEFYWLAKRQTLNVFVYSVTRFGVRTAVVIGTTFVTRQVQIIVWSLVIFEGLRILTLLVYGFKHRQFTTSTSLKSVKKQLAFALPIGAGSVLSNFNTYLGQFFVSMWLGPAALAVYTIGTYLHPIVGVFRNSIADVIMPDIVSQRDVPPQIALRLWQRATVVYCTVMLPIALLLFYYAEIVVETLFTSAYTAAVPIFQIFTLLLVRECFDFGLPLRAVNRTRALFSVSILALAINLVVLTLLWERFGLLTPAISIIVSRICAGFYLAFFVKKYCEFTFSDMLPWLDIGKIAVICIMSTIVLLIGDLTRLPGLLEAMIFGTLYCSIYVAALRMANIREIVEFTDRLIFRLGL